MFLKFLISEIWYATSMVFLEGKQNNIWKVFKTEGY